MLRDLLLLIDQCRDPDPLLAHVLAAAERWDAHLAVAVLTSAPFLGFAATAGPDLALMLQGELLAASREKQDCAARIIQAATMAVELRPLSDDVGGLTRTVAVQGRYADAVLVGPRDSWRDAGFRDRLIEAVLFHSGRPVMILPDGPAPEAIGHAVVGWNATREANHAVHELLRLMRPGGRIAIAVVDPKPSLTGHGSDPGADVARHVARHGFSADVHVLASGSEGVAETLRRFAADEGADLLVTGAYAHSRPRERLLGGVTRDLLADTGLMPVLMAH